jgi:ribonuclease P protein component
MIPYRNRFHGHNSLSYVYKNGRDIRSRLMIVKYIANPHRKNSRLAVVVSKKVMKSAVRRNRIRRRVYEYLRTRLSQLDRSYDIVVIVLSSELLTMPYHELLGQLDNLFNQSDELRKVIR